MTRAEKILLECGEDISNIDRKLGKLGHYFLLYTHTYEQVNEKGKHSLSIPKDPRFDESEFYGLLIDMISDYAENKGIELKGDIMFKMFIRVLTKLERSGDVK